MDGMCEMGLVEFGWKRLWKVLLEFLCKFRLLK